MMKKIGITAKVTRQEWDALPLKGKYKLVCRAACSALPRSYCLEYEAETEKAILLWINPREEDPEPIKIGRFEITEVSEFKPVWGATVQLSLVESPDIELFRELKTSSTYREVEKLFSLKIRGVIFIHNEMEQSVSLRVQDAYGSSNACELDFREVKIYYGLAGEPELPAQSYDDVRFFLATVNMKYYLIHFGKK